jgi:hypothetical protein
MDSGPSTLEPQELAFRLFSGFRLARAVLVAIRLRLADRLADGPASAAELAEASGAHPESLERLLNVLTAAGIFGRDGDGRYEITAASQLLRCDHPRSQRAWLELGLGGEIYEAWGALEDAIRTGRTAFELRHGTSWIDYYRDNPEAGQAFVEAMSSSTRVRRGDPRRRSVPPVPAGRGRGRQPREPGPAAARAAPARPRRDLRPARGPPRGGRARRPPDRGRRGLLPRRAEGRRPLPAQVHPAPTGTTSARRRSCAASARPSARAGASRSSRSSCPTNRRATRAGSWTSTCSRSPAAASAASAGTARCSSRPAGGTSARCRPRQRSASCWRPLRSAAVPG